MTTSPNRAHAIGEGGYDKMLGQFRELADEFLEASVPNRHHGFSNVKETLEELHKGVSKAFPCGAGLGLLGVATDGDVALCHRFAGSDAHKFGTVSEGDRSRAQHAFLEQPSHRQQDRLQHLLGASALFGGLLSRGPYPLRRHHTRTCTTATGFAAGRMSV